MLLPSIAAGTTMKALVAVTISLHPVTAHQYAGSVTVKAGNTLSSISQQEWGKSADWPSLWWANRHSVPNPGAVRVGQKLHIPASHTVPSWMARRAMDATDPQPAAAPAATGAAPAAATSVASYNGASGFQACVIAAESGGNAGAVNPYSGAGGLYGFLPSTWHALGYSGLPQDASVAEQNAAFAREYAASGGGAWSPYDGC
jgi:hypothetical protein